MHIRPLEMCRIKGLSPNILQKKAVVCLQYCNQIWSERVHILRDDL